MKRAKNENPKVIICAAGRGKRLLPLTKNTPKVLIKIGGKTILEHILDSIEETRLVKEVVIIVGYKYRSIKKKIGRKYKNLKIFYVLNSVYERSDNLYSLLLARNYFDRTTIFINGDTIFHPHILKAFIKDPKKDAVLVDFEQVIDNDSMRVKGKNGKLVAIGKRIKGSSDGNAFGMYKLSPQTGEQYLHFAEKYFRRGPRRGGFVVPLRSISKEKPIWLVAAQSSLWAEIDTLEDVLQAKDRLKEIVF